MDPITGIAYCPTSHAKLVARPVSPPSAISASYEFLGVPVAMSYNPMESAKQVLVQRYVQEFRGMTEMGERLVRRLVDSDLEGERGRFEGLVWTGAANEELVAFAEWLMKGGE
jgi:hypothetical protein